MSYKEGKCSKCHKTFQIPEELDEIICIYCGHKMTVVEAMTPEPVIDLAFEAEDLVHLMDYNRPVHELFNRSNYDKNFEAVFNQYKNSLGAYEQTYRQMDSDRQPDFVNQTAQAFITGENQRLAPLSTKEQKKRLYQDNVYTALFVIPIIGHYKTIGTDALADELVHLWRETYKEHQITRGHYEEITGGFKKRRFCYITTAVCEGLGKDDHCQEMQILRQYRDHWLLLQEDGPALIDEYYTTAPAIVTHINSSPDKAGICQSIYDTYLLPCIRLINEGEYQKCKQHYITMIRTLQQ